MRNKNKCYKEAKLEDICSIKTQTADTLTLKWKITFNWDVSIKLYFIDCFNSVKFDSKTLYWSQSGN